MALSNRKRHSDMQKRLTTIAALRVVGMDRQRFNEYVSNGDYACAPDTVPGRARVFDESDMIALRIFAQEVEFGVSPRDAGRLACTVLDGIRRHPEDGTVTVVRGMHLKPFYLAPDDVEVANGEFAGRPVYDRRTFNIAWLRDYVRRGMEEEASIIGPED